MKSIEHIPFKEVLLDVTGGNDKILQSDYKPNGRLPIIDQGESLIGGYTDDISLKYSHELPCIVFGDHTKLLKYIDFDFALGADGTKILLIQKGFDLKFIYYYLHTCQYPSNIGYSRHFKFLKEIKIPKFDIGYQIECRTILDKVKVLRKNQNKANKLTEQFLQSAFIEMFGDPVNNPMAWEKVSIRNISSIVTSGSTPLGGSEVYENKGIAFIRSQNVLMNKIDYSDIVFINEKIHERMKRTWVKKNDVLLNITGASIGRVSYYEGEDYAAN